MKLNFHKWDDKQLSLVPGVKDTEAILAECTFKPDLGTGTFVWRKEIALQSSFHLILYPVLSTVNWRSLQKDGHFDFVRVSV